MLGVTLTRAVTDVNVRRTTRYSTPLSGGKAILDFVVHMDDAEREIGNAKVERGGGFLFVDAQCQFETASCRIRQDRDNCILDFLTHTFIHFVQQVTFTRTSPRTEKEIARASGLRSHIGKRL
jgi:hypothetical protein